MIKIFFLSIGLLYASTAIYSQSSVFDIARTGSLAEVEALYEKFRDTINTANDAGYSPLILACYNGNNEVAGFIAEHCTNVDENSGYGTALMAAVVKGNEEMVTKLLALGADPNISDSNQTTALHYAVMFQKEDMIKKLVDHNANISLKDSNGFTPVEYAEKTNNQHIINLLKL